MGTLMDNNSGESVDLIERARAGDREALNALLTRHRDRLRRMVDMRLDTRLQARLDASDVVQEAYVEVAERLEEYLRDPVAAEVAAKEQNVRNGGSIGRLKLANLRCLLLSSLIRVCEIARRLRFDQDWQPILSRLLGLDRRVNWNVHLKRLADWHVHVEHVRSRFHFRQRLARRMRLFAVAACF